MAHVDGLESVASLAVSADEVMVHPFETDEIGCFGLGRSHRNKVAVADSRIEAADPARGGTRPPQ